MKTQLRSVYDISENVVWMLVSLTGIGDETWISIKGDGKTTITTHDFNWSDPSKWQGYYWERIL